MRVSIIFVNWNSTGYLRECLSSIDQWSHHVDHEIVVVDNASPNADADVLKEDFEFIKLVKSSENLGFAGANNLGFQHSTGDHVLFLNPDTKLNSPAIGVMADQLELLKDAGVIGCRLLNADLSIQTSAIQTFPTILNQALDADTLRRCWPNSRLWGNAALFSSSRAPVPVEVISGACMMIRREVFESVGMFSADYFMYAEDLDLCYKCMRAGYRNYYVGAATVIHYGGGSSNPETATVRKWQSIVFFCRKHYGQLYTIVFALVMSAMALGRLGALAITSPLRTSSSNSKPQYAASAKWVAILKTLLDSGLFLKSSQTSYR